MALFARADIEPIDPSLVTPLVSQVYLEQYFQVAAIALLVYDTIITMDREARYFWKIPKNTVNFVYFANRYTGIFGALSRFYLHSFNANIRSCIVVNWTQNMANWVTVILIDYILMIRALALYSQSAKLSIVLKTLLALEAAFKLGLDIYIVSSDPVVNGGLGKDLTLCGVEGAPVWQWPMVNWIIPMVYGTILMALALYKAAAYWKMSAGFKGFTLVKVLIQDQILYFMLVILCSVFNIINFRVLISNTFVGALLDSLGNPSILSLLGSRMLFNLKEAGERGQNEGTSYNASSRTVSEMEFAEPVIRQRQSGMEDVTSADEGAAEA